MRILHGGSRLEVHVELAMDMMGCPDLLITIGAAVRDSYVVLKDSRSVLLVSHRAWQSVENQAASSSRSPKQIARPSEARDISTGLRDCIPEAVGMFPAYALGLACVCWRQRVPFSRVLGL
jgi:hypothetical protein